MRVGLPQLAMAAEPEPEYAGSQAEVIQMGRHRRNGVDHAIHCAQWHARLSATLGAIAFLLANVQVWYLASVH